MPVVHEPARRAGSPAVRTRALEGDGLTALRIVVALLATLALLAVWRPAVVRAQEAGVQVPQDSAARPAMTTHTVKAGETLWALAVRYYGDGHRWRELAQRNGLGDGERPLLIGTVLRVPASPPVADGAVRPDTSVPKVALTAARPRPPAGAAAPRSLAAQTGKPAGARAATAARTDPDSAVASPADEAAFARSVARIGIVAPGAERLARGRDEATIFTPSRPDVDTAALRQSLRPRLAPPRRGEYDAAPYAIASALPRLGAIAGRVGVSPAEARAGEGRLHLADEVVLRVDSGATLVPGDRVVAVEASTMLGRDLRLVEPRAVLRVLRVEPGQPVVARIERQMGIVTPGLAIVPRAGEPAPSGTRIDTVPGGDLETTVRWVAGEALVPSLQTYLLLDVPPGAGVRAGDQFSLVQREGAGEAAREARIAVARVVRVDETGSTAIVVRQDRPGIAAGVTARRTGRAR
jgi:hypothetical protein